MASGNPTPVIPGSKICLKVGLNMNVLNLRHDVFRRFHSPYSLGGRSVLWSPARSARLAGGG